MKKMMTLTALLCLLTVYVLPVKAQRWVTEVENDPYIQYQQWVTMDRGNAVLGIGSNWDHAYPYSGMESIGGLLKVRSDGSWISQNVVLPGKQLFLCTATALDDGNCMVFGFQDMNDPAVTYYRYLHVMVVDSLLQTVAERDYRVDIEGMKGFKNPVFDIYSSMRCTKASDGNVILAVSLDYTDTTFTQYKRFRFYEFSPSGDIVASRTQPEYVNGVSQGGFNDVRTIFPKKDSDGFVLLGQGPFRPKTNNNLGIWNIDRAMNIIHKSPIFFNYPFFFGPDDLASDGHWYSGDRFMVYLEKITSLDEPYPEGWLFMLDTLAGRHGSILIPPLDSTSISPDSFGCSTAYVNDSTIFVVSHTPGQGIEKRGNITLVDRNLNLLGRKVLKDEGWSYRPQTPVALNDNSVVFPVRQYLIDEDKLTIYCLTRSDIQITWDATSETVPCSGTAYPNPACTRIHIPVPDIAAGQARLKITDTQGRLYADGPVRSAGNIVTVDIANLDTGTYIYQITSNSGTIASGTFVKTH